MKKFIWCFWLLTLPMKAALAGVSAESNKVLMLISGYGSESRPELSYDLEELAQAYLVLHDNGVQLEIATPKGGPVLVKSNKDDLPFIQRFKSLALDKLANTLSTKTVAVDNYNGVFIVGGAGAMFDLPKDESTQAMLTKFVASNTNIAAVCHGPAAIANIKLPNGEFFIADKQVNSFSNVEEHAFSGEHISEFPFLIQNKLIENGANYVHNDPMLPFVAMDGNLITAQNPPSVPKAAEALLFKLGITPKPRTLFKDEATMALIAKAKNSGSVAIDLALAAAPESYDLNYLALYGFYAYPLASEENKAKELDLMKTIANYFSHPEYEVQLIRALAEQKQTKEARARLDVFVQQYPEHNAKEKLVALVKA